MIIKNQFVGYMIIDVPKCESKNSQILEIKFLISSTSGILMDDGIIQWINYGSEKIYLILPFLG